MHPGSAVWFNAGTLGGEADVMQLALVTHDNGDSNLNVVAVDANGAWQHHNSVPRRDPSDYDGTTGGDTWHPIT